MLVFVIDLFFTLIHFLIVICITPILIITVIPGQIILGAFQRKRKVVSEPAGFQEHDLSITSWKTLYLKMSDGIDIAVDIWLPQKDSSCSYPVVINFARYYRSCRLWWPFLSFNLFQGKPFALLEHESVKGFLAEGIAVVVYDVRGSGASLGVCKYPWWPREREDSKEIIDWVMKQPFCNKKIGVYGTSYSANASYHASFLFTQQKTSDAIVASNQPLPDEGILACASLYGFWDIYR